MRTMKRAKRTWDVVTNCFENFLVDLSRSNFLKKRITDREKLAEYTQIFVKKGRSRKYSNNHVTSIVFKL